MYEPTIAGSRKSSRNVPAQDNFEHDVSACLICAQLQRQDQSEIDEGTVREIL